MGTITLTSPLSDSAQNDAEHTRFHGQDSLFLRHSSNPILIGKDWPYPINSVFNAGAGARLLWSEHDLPDAPIFRKLLRLPNLREPEPLADRNGK